MKKSAFLTLYILVISFGCGQAGTKSSNRPSSSQDSGTLEDAETSTVDGSTSTSDANMENGQDAQTTDGGTSRMDAGHITSDGGISGFMCDPMFGQADACGGSAVGTWNYREGCIDPAVFGMLSAQCQGVTRRNENQVTTGFFSITSTMTYRRVFHDHFSTDVDVPASCVNSVGGCSLIKSTIEFFVPGSQVSCAGSAGGGCDCHAEINKNISDRGTYTLPSPGVARLSADDGSKPADYFYCVDNGVFRYKGSSTMTAQDHSVSYVLTP